MTLAAQERLALRVLHGYACWRRLALHALAQGLPPDALQWLDGDAAACDLSLPLHAGPLTADDVQTVERDGVARPQPDVRVSRALAELLGDAALYRCPQRWAFLYRVLWRWHQGDRSAALAADEDGARLHAMVKAVRRARHDMQAYVRFQRCDADGGDAMPQYVAWYAPEHDVLALAAAHFARRMGNTTWLITTPDGAAQWDGATLHYTSTPPNADTLRAMAAGDAVESLWLRYYQSIFNPARLNETALRQRMPARFWKHLPEAALIPSLIVQARTGMSRTGQVSAVRDMPGKTIVPAAAPGPARHMGE